MLYAIKSWQMYDSAERTLNKETNKYEIVYKLKYKEVFVSIISPYHRDAIVMYHSDRKQSVFYEKKDLERVMTLLTLKKIKFITIPIKPIKDENRKYDPNRVCEL
jgi:hypothetical protein